MTAPLFQTDIEFTQKVLCASGFYTFKLDGQWGPKTSAAQDAFDKEFERIRGDFGTMFDPRSELNIYSLIPKAQIAARHFLVEAKKLPFQVKIISGTRGCAEQNRLYAQGRNGQGHIVTNARCGHSNHNFAIAWDVGVFVNGEYYDGTDVSSVKARLEEKTYTDLALYEKGKFTNFPKIEWGGDWPGFRDTPHYQLFTGRKLDQVRACFDTGQPFV